MVTIYLVMQITSLVLMQDPKIGNETRPIYKEETEHWGRMNLNEYNFNFGVYFIDKTDNPIRIPEGIGRVISQEIVGDDIVTGSERAAIPCSDPRLFSKVNQELTEASQNAKEYGYCVDPEHGAIMDVETFNTQTQAVLTFQTCAFNPDIDQSLCWDKYQLKEWADTNGVKINYLSTFEWIDLLEPIEYEKETIV